MAVQNLSWLILCMQYEGDELCYFNVLILSTIYIYAIELIVKSQTQIKTNFQMA
jgi:hypothetical protein